MVVARLTINISSGPARGAGRMMTSVAAGIAPSGTTAGGVGNALISVMAPAIPSLRQLVIPPLRPASAQGRMRRQQPPGARRSEEHTSELQSLMRISYALFFL